MEQMVLAAIIGGSLALAAVVAWVWYRRFRLRHHSYMGLADYQSQRLSPSCPKCGENMQPGFVISPHGLHFLADLGRTWGHSFDAEGGLDNTVNTRFRTAGNGAWRCEQCAMLVIDHSCLVQK